ncbi:MAG: hypothetical protein AB7R90_18330 [Reyranellaceae bacterium]
MGLSRFLPIAIAALLALPAHAQKPKPQFEEGNVAARNLMEDCAEVWTVKDRQELKDSEQDLLNATQNVLKHYAEVRQKAVQLVTKAEQDLERLNDTLAAASFAEATAWEKAEGKGLISKQRATAIGVSVAQNTNRLARDAAEAELKTARSVLNGINRRMIGWFAYGVGMSECLRDQIAYVEKTNPNQPPLRPPGGERPLPQAPAVNTANIQRAQGTVSGAWSGQCTYKETTFPANGRFSMQIDAQRNVTAAFVDGAAATVRGSMQPNGAINATGTVAMASDLVVSVTMAGQMSWNQNGTLRGDGSFRSTGSEMRCNGTWRG